MQNTHRLLATVLTALALSAMGCGSSQAITPALPSATRTITVLPTPGPEPRPSPTLLAAPSPTPVVPTALPTPAATTFSSGGGCTNTYAFVSDVSIPDETAMTAGQVFTKTWRVRNTGTCTWGDGYTLTFVSGHAMTALPSIPVSRTAPGATVDLSVLMNVPTTPGSYQGLWALKNPAGVALKPNLWVRIKVP